MNDRHLRVAAASAAPLGSKALHCTVRETLCGTGGCGPWTLAPVRRLPQAGMVYERLSLSLVTVSTQRQLAAVALRTSAAWRTAVRQR